jgi:acyl-coenzyme A thioesterase PaaI-like protein
VSYLKPASIGPLRATSRIVKRDARTANVEAELKTESDLVLATARAELRIVSRKS